MNRYIILSLLFFLSFGNFADAFVLNSEDKKGLAAPFDRGINTSNFLFIPKGTIGGGTTFSYNTLSIGNSKNSAGFTVLSSLISDLKGTLNTFEIAPSASYFIWDNTSVGARLEYKRTVLELNSLNLSLTESLGIKLEDYGYFKQTYTASVTMRNYMPVIASSKRLSLFAEGRLTGGYGQCIKHKMEGGLKHGTYEDVFKMGLSLVPGVCVFITNELAFEVQIGVMGIDFEKTIQKENQVKRSEMVSSNANFNINLFSIGFGINFYILDKKYKSVKK